MPPTAKTENRPGPRRASTLRAVYKQVWPEALRVSQAHGYALALHGSLERDMDLVAFPWARGASTPRALAKAIARALGGRIDPDHDPDEKLYGRKAWIIRLGGGAHLDFSVTPKG